MNILARINTSEVTENMIEEFLKVYLTNSKIVNHTLGLREKEGYIEMYIERNSVIPNEEIDNE